jgi:hypothetical protein
LARGICGSSSRVGWNIITNIGRSKVYSLGNVVSVAENLLSPFAPRKKRNSRYFRGAKGDDYANPLFPQQKQRTIHAANANF